MVLHKPLWGSEVFFIDGEFKSEEACLETLSGQRLLSISQLDTCPTYTQLKNSKGIFAISSSQDTVA